MSNERKPDEPEYESIRRTGGDPDETNPPDSNEPEYGSIRRTGGHEDEEVEEAEERESGGGAV